MEFQQALQYYAIEGFLSRLSRTEFASMLVVKGATMLRVWDGAIARPTRDIDFMGRVGNSPEAVEEVVRACLKMELPEDGLVFEEYVASEQIMVEGRYPGISLKIRGNLDGARFVLRLDVGVDDVMVPEPEWLEYPTMLEGPWPRILCYHSATVVAEKFEAMVSLGLVNSRMKDFYDIWMLATTQVFEGEDLRRAILATFAKRGTPLPSTPPVALTEEFFAQERTTKMWNTYAHRLRAASIQAPETLAEVADVIITFVMPAVHAGKDAALSKSWTPSGGWQ